MYMPLCETVAYYRSKNNKLQRSIGYDSCTNHILLSFKKSYIKIAKKMATILV